MSFAGMSPDRKFVEMVELTEHRGSRCQFHPEFKSKPTAPHPLFKDFIRAARAHKHARKEGASERRPSSRRRQGAGHLPPPNGQSA